MPTTARTTTLAMALLPLDLAYFDGKLVFSSRFRAELSEMKADWFMAKLTKHAPVPRGVLHTFHHSSGTHKTSFRMGTQQTSQELNDTPVETRGAVVARVNGGVRYSREHRMFRANHVTELERSMWREMYLGSTDQFYALIDDNIVLGIVERENRVYFYNHKPELGTTQSLSLDDREGPLYRAGRRVFFTNQEDAEAAVRGKFTA